jgi:hypothetical protein
MFTLELDYLITNYTAKKSYLIDHLIFNLMIDKRKLFLATV